MICDLNRPFPIQRAQFAVGFNGGSCIFMMDGSDHVSVVFMAGKLWQRVCIWNLHVGSTYVLAMDWHSTMVTLQQEPYLSVSRLQMRRLNISHSTFLGCGLQARRVLREDSEV